MIGTGNFIWRMMNHEAWAVHDRGTFKLRANVVNQRGSLVWHWRRPGRDLHCVFISATPGPAVEHIEQALAQDQPR